MTRRVGHSCAILRIQGAPPASPADARALMRWQTHVESTSKSNHAL